MSRVLLIKLRLKITCAFDPNLFLLLKTLVCGLGLEFKVEDEEIGWEKLVLLKAIFRT